MADIAEIMDMLDWHMPSEIQSKGISLTRNTETIILFIQPVTPEHMIFLLIRKPELFTL